MKKRFFAKLTAAAIAAAQVATGTVFAAVTQSGDSTAFWKTDFNEFTSGTLSYMTMSNSATAKATYQSEKIAENDYAIKMSSNHNEGKVFVKTSKTYDFSKPIVVSYDFKMAEGSTKAFRADLSDGSNIGISNMPKIEYISSQYWVRGYQGGTITTSSKTIKTGEIHTMTQVIVYDEESNLFKTKTYLDGDVLVKKDTTTPLEGTLTKSASLANTNLMVRFYPYSGGTVTVDNVSVCNLDELKLPESLGWVSDTNGAQIVYTNAQYKDSNGKSVTVPAALPANKLTSASQYTMKKYNIKTDPLMLDGTDYTSSNVVWSGKTGLTISGLKYDDATAECIVMKLNDPGIIENLAGEKNTNQYIALYQKTLSSAPIIRESRILDADGNAMDLKSGKLPVTAKTLEFTVANSKAETLDAANVKIEGNGSSKASTKNGSVYTIALETLAEGTDYTVTVGDTVQTLTTTGERAKMNAAIERFDNSSTVSDMYISDKDYITVAHDADKGVLWKSSFPTNGAASHTKYAMYAFDDAFDFTKGDMLVSFDVELNQEIGWISSSEFYLFNPMLVFNGTSTVYMPYIYTYGIRARKSDGGPLATTDGNATMSKGDKCTVSVLCHYNSDTKQLEYTQFVDGKRLMSDATTAIPVNTVNITDENLDTAPQIRFAGRGFGDGGVYIDNLKITTIDGMTADRLLTITNSTATIDLKSTVLFAEGTDAELTNPQYTNTLEKNDIIVTKYDNTDKLLANGTVVTDFSFNPASLTIGKLDSACTYVIKLSDTSKLTSINGSPIKVDAFKAADSPSGLVESVIYDSNNYQIYADKEGKWPSNAAKIKLVFADEHSSVKIGDTAGVPDENGGYVFDYSSNALQANTQYTVTVDGTEYGTFTTSDGSVSVSKPKIGDGGKASVTVTNTTSTAKSVYIIHAAYKDNDELSDIRYEKIDVSAGNSASYTMTESPSLDGATVQKVFVWDGFAEMTPYCEATVSEISN